MVKRMISLLTAVAMVALSLMAPCVAASERKYKVSFSLILDNSPEAAFRRWASNLVTMYRSNYAIVDDTGAFHRSKKTVWELEKGKWTERQIMKDAALYHPYYELVQKKLAFDVSIDANAQNIFGKQTRQTEYTLDLLGDAGKRRELIAWYLTQVLKEKVAVQADFLTSGAYLDEASNRGYFVFDVATGTMRYEPTLEWVQVQSEQKAWVQTGQVAIEALDAWLKGLNAYHIAKRSNQQMLDRLGRDPSTWQEVQNAVISSIRDTLIEAFSTLSRETLTQLHEQANSTIQNAIRGKLAEDLANQLLFANRNVVGYLKATYCSNQVALIQHGNIYVAEYGDTVSKLLALLESEAFRTAALQEAESMALKAVQDNMQLENVLTDGQVAYLVVTQCVRTVLSGTLDTLKDVLTTPLDEWAEDFKAPSSGSTENESFKEYGERSLMKQLLTAVKDWVSEDVFDHFAKDGLLRAWDDYCTANMPASDGWSIWDALVENPIGVLVEPLLQFQVIPYEELALALPSMRETATAQIDLADIVRDVWHRTQANLNEDGTSYMQYICQCAGKRLMNAMMNTIQMSMAHRKESTPALVETKAETMPLFGQYAYCFVLTVAMDVLYTDFSSMPYLSDTEQRVLDSQYKALRSAVIEIQSSVLTNDLKTEKLIECGNDAMLLLYNTQEIALRHPNNNLWQDIFAQWTAKIASEEWGFDAAGQILQTAIKDKKVGQSLLDHLLKRDTLKQSFQKEVLKLEDDAEHALSLPEIDELARQWQEVEHLVNDPMMQALWRITGEIWEVGEQLVVATNQWANALEGEDKVSMMVARLLPAYWNSNALEITLVQATGARDRTAALIRGNTVEDFDTGSANMRIWMNAQEILDSYATPELGNIKRLTDMILLQMHEDQVGMGAYLTLVSNRVEYGETVFYQDYLNDSVLLTEIEAVELYNEINRLIQWAEESYDPSWDALF